jgi:hypothetical protein
MRPLNWRGLPSVLDLSQKHLGHRRIEVFSAQLYKPLI